MITLAGYLYSLQWLIGDRKLNKHIAQRLLKQVLDPPLLSVMIFIEVLYNFNRVYVI
jgi:hypothetical protein